MLMCCLPAFGVDRAVQASGNLADDVRHVRQLPVEGDWHGGWIEFRWLTPLDRGFSYRNGYHAVYAADVLPGREYALGLRYPAREQARVHVMVFDRWPFDAKAKRYDLPMGPVVRTGRHTIEYRWRLGISRRSPGQRLFVVVEAEPPAGKEARRFRHDIYLVDSPRRAKDLLGKGITYLRGPNDLYLVEAVTEQPVIIVEAADYGSADSVDRAWLRGRNLIRNGDFELGLTGWELISDEGQDTAMRHLAVGDDGLRFWSDDERLDFGVRQRLLRHIGHGESLQLAATLRIDREGPASTGRPTSPLAISICYTGQDDSEHCGAGAQRWRFTIRAGKDRHNGTVRIPKGEWYEFEFDLLKLSPAPEVIKSVTIEGGGVAKSEAWVRSISLTVH